MSRVLLALALAIASSVVFADPVAAQEPSARAMFESGKFQASVDAVSAQGEGAPQPDVFLAAQALTRLDRRDEARDVYRRLDTGNEEDPWTFIARSAIAGLDGNQDAALEAADRAVALGPDHFHAHYQRGLVQMQRDDFAGAAESLERATEIDGSHAYAHYYAGLAQNKARHVDKMARHFKTFVALAPNAPERPQVERLLRALR